MNKVVTREMRAGDLPQAIRGDIDPASAVRVTVEEIAARPQRSLLELVGIGRGVYGSDEEILADIRELRRDREP